MPIASPSSSTPAPGVLHGNATLVPSPMQGLLGVPRLPPPTPCDALHLAIERNDLPSMLLELAKVEDPNVPDGNGETAVMIAMKKDRMALVEALVRDPRVDLGAPAPFDSNAPRFAAELAMARLVREANPEQLNQAHTDAWPHEQSPLHWAITHHKPQLLHWLMVHGADPQVVWSNQTIPERIHRERLVVAGWHAEPNEDIRHLMAITGQRSEALVRAFDESMVVVEMRALNEVFADAAPSRSPETPGTPTCAGGAGAHPNVRSRSRL